MSNRLLIMRQENDEKLEEICRKIGDITNKIDAINLKLYEDKVRNLDDEFLAFEFSDKIGDAIGEYETLMYYYGRKFIEEYLIDHYAISQYEKMEY